MYTKQRNLLTKKITSQNIGCYRLEECLFTHFCFHVDILINNTNLKKDVLRTTGYYSLFRQDHRNGFIEFKKNDN